MTRAIRSAEEIQEYVRVRLHEDREVQEDKSTIKVPLPQQHEPGDDGCNWGMVVFSGDAAGYTGLIAAVVADAQRKFNLPG